MTLPNPNVKFAKSNGIDLPIMTVYLVGRIAGNCMEQCLAWRKKLIKHYKNYKPIYSMPHVRHDYSVSERKLIGYESYPISFICPLNSGESKTADKLGLKSHIPRNLIYDKDILSLKTAGVIVANLDDFMEVGIEKELDSDGYSNEEINGGRIPLSNEELFHNFHKLKDAIKNRRPNLGSHYEVTVAIENRKPTILIAGNEHNKYILENHPFFSRASVIVLDVDELIEKKWLQTLYKAQAGAIYED